MHAVLGRVVTGLVLVVTTDWQRPLVSASRQSQSLHGHIDNQENTAVVTVIRVHLSTTLLFLDIGRSHIVGARHRSRPNC